MGRQGGSDQLCVHSDQKLSVLAVERDPVVAEQPGELGPDPSTTVPTCLLPLDPDNPITVPNCPLGDPDHLAVEASALVMRGHLGVEPDGLDRGREGGIGGGEDRRPVYLDRRHRERARTEEVLCGRWLDAMETCPIGQVHTPTSSGEHVRVVSHRLLPELLATFLGAHLRCRSTRRT